MIRGLTVSLGLIGLLAGCGSADSDGDGISNKEEKELGLDPKAADSDGDGIEDGAEIDAGTNPLEADTDGDGLSDLEETDEGTDPLNADSDEDGLLDGDELEFGADPLNPDSDEDGLNDGEEVELGTDPILVDTDEDTYSDHDEDFEGTDPLDKKDRIYQGKWPYYFGKEDVPQAVADPELPVEKKDMIGRFAAKDQNGEVVDLYDFYNDEGKYVVLDVSAQWCPPCQDVASWLDGDQPTFEGYWPGIKEAVKDGDILWVTVLSEDRFGQPSSWETAAEWYDSYHTKQVPVLADPDYLMVGHTDLGSWPHIIILNPDLTVKYMPDQRANEYWIHSMDKLINLLD